MSARRCALEALETWEDTSRYAEDILADLSTRYQLSPADRGLAVDILYGTIRNLFLVDEIIDRLRRGRIKAETQNLLRIGLYQLFCSEIAEHAAVNETVNLARKHERGLVNAILRNAQRQKAELQNEIATWPLEDQYSQPSFLIDRWEAEHGKEAALAFCQWNNKIPQSYARINRLHPDTEAVNRVESETHPCHVGPEFPDFFTFEKAPRMDWIEEGLIYVQDPSTSLACRLLDPQADETILDACAAPGGKTALLSLMLNGKGRISACDSAAPRIERMQENFSRLHVENVESSQVDWTKPEEIPFEPETFDGILLDVPCSNSGVIRRRVDVRWRIQPGDFERQAELQTLLLANVIPFLKPGGRVVYSTCSIDRVENEEVAAASGLTLEKSVHSHPWESGFDGAYAALLRK